MITYQYTSKSKRVPGVQCLQCNDLETQASSEELYIVATAKQRIIKYVGMSTNFWCNRPVKSHNKTYNSTLSKYPDSYVIFRFKCENSGNLERAGLEKMRGTKSWNRAWKNGHELTEESMETIEMLCLTYNLKIDVTSKKA